MKRIKKGENKGKYTFKRLRDDNALYVVNEEGKKIYDECNEKLRAVKLIRLACRRFNVSPGWVALYYGNNFAQKCVEDRTVDLIFFLISNQIYALHGISTIDYKTSEQQKRKPRRYS